MKNKQQHIAIYSRKSKFTQKGESIGNQVELCRNYIAAHYGEASQSDIEVYEDEGFSGSDLNRPGFIKMMEAAKNKSLKAIIVYRLDRISRSISDFSNLIQELSRLGIDFVSIKEQFDTSTPMGRAMMYIASVFSQLERETIAERIRDNMLQLAKTGRWLGGRTPMGFSSHAVKTVTVDGKEKKSCTLELIPQEAQIINLIYELYMEYDSQTLTEAHLMQRGIKTRQGKYFTRFAIKSILQNPVYAAADAHTLEYFTDAGACISSEKRAFDGNHGLMVYNRTYQEKGKSTVYRPESQWIVSVGRHTGLIPGKLWVMVQASLSRNKSKSYRKPRKNEALLTGLLYCSCGSRMYPRLSSRREADGTRSYTYVCKMKERSRGSLCSVKNVNGNALDQAITEKIKAMPEDKKAFADSLRNGHCFYTEGDDICKEQLLMLRQEKRDVENKIQGLVDSLSELDDKEVRECVALRISHLKQEHENTIKRIAETERIALLDELSDKQLEDICGFLTCFSSMTEKMTPQQSRVLIRSVIKKIVWNGKSAHVLITEFDSD